MEEAEAAEAAAIAAQRAARLGDDNGGATHGNRNTNAFSNTPDPHWNFNPMSATIGVVVRMFMFISRDKHGKGKL
jgi:hypothetical protein